MRIPLFLYIALLGIWCFTICAKSEPKSESKSAGEYKSYGFAPIQPEQATEVSYHRAHKDAHYNSHISYSESALSVSGFTRSADGRRIIAGRPVVETAGPRILINTISNNDSDEDSDKSDSDSMSGSDSAIGLENNSNSQTINSQERETEVPLLVAEESLLESTDSLVYDIGDHDIGATSTAIAVLGGNVEALELLIKAGVDIDMRSGSNGWTPLMYAAKSGREEVVEYILDQGANARLLSDAQESAFSIAVGEDHRLIALMIADVNILQAMRANDVDSILNMVRVGGHVNIANSAGWTPLIYLVNQGEGYSDGRGDGQTHAYLNEIKELIVTHKANVNKPENDGWTALMFASFHGYTDVVQLLMRYGADTAITTKHISSISGRKLTALSVATFRRNTEVIKILTDYRPVAGLRGRQFAIL